MSILAQTAQGFGQGFVDSLNFSVFFSYILRSAPLRDVASYVFGINFFLLVTYLASEWVTEKLSGHYGSGALLALATHYSWQMPMRIVVDAFGIGGWQLYNKMYCAAWAEAKKENAANIGASPTNTLRQRVAVGEKLNRSVALIVVSIIKPVVLGVWISLIPSVVPEPILELVFPAPPIRTAVSFVLVCLVHVLGFLADTMAYAFFCFDSRISTIVVNGNVLKLADQLKWFEYQWPYFVGYGALQYVCSAFLFKGWYASAAFGFLQPMNVVTSLGSISTPGPTCDLPVPLFTMVVSSWVGPLQKLRRVMKGSTIEE